MATQSTSQSGQAHATKKPPPLPQKATVISLAGVEQSRTSAISSIDHSILERIKKCLSRANHPNTAELEAKTAWHLASKLMAEHNVTQADVLSQVTNDEDLAQLGGESTVAITNPSNPTRVVLRQWVGQIAYAMETLFDCSSYSSQRATSVVWVFYGIAANTVPAAMSFEMAHNLTLEWAKAKKGPKYDYCMGMGDGLVKIAEDEKKAEVKRARGAEKAERDADEALTPTPTASLRIKDEPFPNATQRGNGGGVADECKGGSAAQIKVEEDDGSPSSRGSPDGNGEDTSEEDDDSGDDEDFHLEPTFKHEDDDKPIDITVDLDDQLRRMLPQRDPPASPEVLDKTAIDDTPKSIWFTSQALVHFRQSAKKVAEEYLNEKDMKLGKRRKREWSVKDPELYRQGVRDSKDVDVKRRRIEASK